MKNAVEDKWKIIKGENLILLVASHNRPHNREGVIKPADIGTGLLVEDLCVQTKAWGMVSETVQEDPNWYKDSKFRNKLENIVDTNGIKAVIDIHGRKHSWQHLLDAYPNNSFRRRFGVQVLRDFAIQPFKDNDQLTITEDLDSVNIPGVEIEIRKDGRIKGTGLYDEVVNTLKQLIDSLL